MRIAEFVVLFPVSVEPEVSVIADFDRLVRFLGIHLSVIVNVVRVASQLIQPYLHVRAGIRLPDVYREISARNQLKLTSVHVLSRYPDRARDELEVIHHVAYDDILVILTVAVHVKLGQVSLLLVDRDAELTLVAASLGSANHLLLFHEVGITDLGGRLLDVCHNAARGASVAACERYLVLVAQRIDACQLVLIPQDIAAVRSVDRVLVNDIDRRVFVQAPAGAPAGIILQQRAVAVIVLAFKTEPAVLALTAVDQIQLLGLVVHIVGDLNPRIPVYVLDVEYLIIRHIAV